MYLYVLSKFKYYIIFIFIIIILYYYTRVKIVIGGTFIIFLRLQFDYILLCNGVIPDACAAGDRIWVSFFPRWIFYKAVFKTI